MIKVGFITTPLNSAHAIRGVGFYTKHLLSHLHALADTEGFSIQEISALQSGFDLIHYPYFDPFIHSLPFTKSASTIVTIHDLIPLEFPDHYPPGVRGLINLTLQRFSLANILGVITDSAASAASIHKYFKIPPAKIKIVYLAASEIYQPLKSVSKLKSLSQKYHLPEKFVLYVGDINWNKNISTLIKSCISSNLPLVIVGKQAGLIESMNSLHPELRHLNELKSLFNSKLIHRLGFVPDEDLVGIYNLATVYCQPSFAEGFGLPVLEAMACGTPVVCSHSHSLPEIAGNAAVYFAPSDTSALSQTLSKIISDSAYHQSLSHAGLLQSQKFSWDKTAQNTLLAYKNLL
jgi:glycosyltransferase involved in cell wall biosynthesis